MVDKDTLMELRQRLELVEHELYNWEKKFQEDSSYEVFERVEELYNEVKRLRLKLYKISGPTYSDGVLDLYLDEEKQDDSLEQYDIMLCGTDEIIGNVVVSKEYSESLFGNIGYVLNREYRGHGYMLEALEILRGPLIDEGIKKPLFSVKPNNKSSIRTIEKFGGHMIESKLDNFIQYEVDLENNDNMLHR